MVLLRLRARLAPLFRFFRRESVWVVLATLFSLWIHAKYRLTAFGEQDAARLSRDAIVWHLQDQIVSSQSTYRMHTSAGYIHLLKLAMDHGLKIAKLARFMNSASVALGTACALALYALFRQFSAPRYAALAIVMYSMTPGFWLGNIYGMPTIPALCGFTLSVLWFVRACRLQKLRSVWLPVLILASFACLFWAASFKADLLLSTGVFVVLALSARGRRVQMLALATLVVLGAVFANNRYVHKVLTPAPDEPRGTTAFLKSWNEQFPFKISALFDPANNQTIVHCAGGLLFSVLVVSVLVALVQGGRPRRMAATALVWALPPVLFWGLLFGNNARHSVYGLAPLFLVAAHFVFRAVNERTGRAALLGLLLMALSYESDIKGHGPVAPASNLLDSAKKLKEETQSYARSSHETALNPAPKRVVIGTGVTTPYLDFEVFAAAKNPVLVAGWELHDGQQITVFAHSGNRRQDARTERNYLHDGYVLLSR